jgi:hypothetical protein
MGGIQRIIVALALMGTIVLAETPERLEQRIRDLEQRVDLLSALQRSSNDAHKPRLEDVEPNEISPDSQVTNWLPTATDVSKSLEWRTDWTQINLFDFPSVNKGAAYIADSDIMEGDNKYMVLVRQQVPAPGVPTLRYAVIANTDVKAAVDANATADYVGANENDGFLRIGTIDTTDGLDKDDGGDFVTLYHHDTSDAADWTASADLDVLSALDLDTYGHVVDWSYKNLQNAVDARVTAKLPNGNANYDILYWYNGAWTLLPKADADYKVLQRKADDSLGYDWTRLH